MRSKTETVVTDDLFLFLWEQKFLTEKQECDKS